MKRRLPFLRVVTTTAQALGEAWHQEPDIAVRIKLNWFSRRRPTTLWTGKILGVEGCPSN